MLWPLVSYPPAPRLFQRGAPSLPGLEASAVTVARLSCSWYATSAHMVERSAARSSAP